MNLDGPGYALSLLLIGEIYTIKHFGAIAFQEKFLFWPWHSSGEVWGSEEDHSAPHR